ncbi:MAG TPA: blaR1 peptidase M56 [Flavobacteriaceae bacterium]|nr:blaR1 peptidase M56 [Flavobacteriaceae bacterium]
MIHYFLQVVLFQLLFLVVYDLFLKKETFFNYNRVYLLVTSVLGFVIPFIKLDVLQQQIPQAFKVQLPAVLIGNPASGEVVPTSTILDTVVIASQGFSATEIALCIYATGVFIASLLFALKLRKIYRLKQTATLQKMEPFTLALLPDTEKAFTFLNTIFLGTNLSETQKSHIIQHELVHAKQRHTLDLLFFELLKIGCWFNPMVYLFQQKLRTLHEFTADRLVASTNKSAYYQTLLSEVFGTTNISFVNTFYSSSLIKKRIVMLQKTNSKKIFQLKYLLLIPAVCAMLFYTSCSSEKENVEDNLADRIANLSAEISTKETLTQAEKDALVTLIYNNFPEGTKGISGEKGKLLYEEWQTENLSDVPFAKIQKVPAYPGCEGSNEEVKKCTSKLIQTFVGENFNTKLANEVNLSGRQRISVQFKIDRTGSVIDVKARAAHPSLEAEAIRVVSTLPKMTPGEENGEPVNVIYALPIIFQIDE